MPTVAGRHLREPPTDDRQGVFVGSQHDFCRADRDLHLERSDDVTPVAHARAVLLAVLRLCEACLRRGLGRGDDVRRGRDRPRRLPPSGVSGEVAVALLTRGQARARCGRRLQDLAPARGHSSDDDVEFLAGSNGCRQVDGEQAREILPAAGRDRHVGHAAGDSALDRVRVGGGEQARAKQSSGEIENLGGVDLRPVDVRGTADRHATPVDHQLVGVVEQVPSGRRDRRTRPYVEGLRDAVTVRRTRVVRVGDLEIALGELVGVLRAGRHAIAVEDRCLVVGDLGDEAVVRPGHERLHGRAIDRVGRIVDVEEAPVVGERLITRRNLDGPVIDPADSVFRVGYVAKIGSVAGGEEREGVSVRSGPRRLRSATRQVAEVSAARLKVGVCALGRPHPEEDLDALSGVGRPRRASQPDPGNREVVVAEQGQRERSHGERCHG